MTTADPPHPDTVYLQRAADRSLQSTCHGPYPRKPPVGCVLVKDGQVIGEGWNCSPAGEPRCTDVGHLLDDQGRCQRTLHAEEWALAYAHTQRHDTTGAVAYLTREPCLACLEALAAAGVRRVVHADLHRPDRFITTAKRARELGVTLCQVVGP